VSDCALSVRVQLLTCLAPSVYPRGSPWECR
jgi:hypothetical protein